MTFQDWLESQISSSNFTMKDIADLTKLSPSYLSMLKTGERKSPTRRTVEKISRALNVPLDEALRAAGLSPIVAPVSSAKPFRPKSIAQETLTREWGYGEPEMALVIRVEFVYGEDSPWRVRLSSRSLTAEGAATHCKVRWIVDGKERGCFWILAGSDAFEIELVSGRNELHWELGGGGPGEPQCIPFVIPERFCPSPANSAVPQGPAEPRP